MRIPVVILAGGRSSRFGSDKARARAADGRPLIVHIAERLGPVASRIEVIAREANAYADLGLATRADATPDLGPMGGLATALEGLGPDEPWMLLSACDWAGLQTDWAQRLIDAINPAVRCVLYRAEVPEPLLALYRRDLAREVAAAMAADRRSLRELIARLARKELPAPPGWDAARNINTPADLATE